MELLNETYLEAAREDFDGFLKKHEWKNAQAIIDNLYDLNLTVEATKLRKEYLNAQYDYAEDIRYEPVEDSEIPFITPEEDDAPVKPYDKESIADMHGVSVDTLEDLQMKEEEPRVW
jgi:hypothetical protein